MPLDSEITAAVATLRRGSECIDAVLQMNSEENRFTRALQDLQRLAEHRAIPVAIVGGLGAIHFGYPAATQDIDIAVGRDHLPAVIEAAQSFGFKVAWESKLGWHTLTHDDVEINIVPEGGKARDSAPTLIPGPVQMGVTHGLSYASIESWMELKISSGRQKDRAHVVEVLKLADAQTVQSIREHLHAVHDQYETEFVELMLEAESERQQESDRR
ncbi:MAG: hypothetical protein R3C59_24375 [Planctomycetaceae bacterium]